ncbi:MAG TPA: hypothetical protein VIN61_09625 [Gammaproteobacteria bacterium]
MRKTTSRLALALLAAGSLGAAHAQVVQGPPVGGQPAPEENADAVEPQASDALDGLRNVRDALIAAADFTAAKSPALEIVESQDQGAVLPEDLARLGRIHAELGEFEDAELRYVQAIESVARTEGEFSIRLVDLYRALGRSYIRNAQYPEAIAALEQAQHITQRNLGLFNVEQSELIDDMTTAYLGAGNTVDARRLQIERLDNAIRRFGENDLRVVPYRVELANYFQRSRLPVSAREQYEEVVRLQSSLLGEQHPDLMSPLRELVRIDLTTTQGENEPLRERLATLLASTSGGDPLERALSYAVLGDWAIVKKDPAAAAGFYARAWEAAAADGQVDPADVFGAPVMIDFVAPLSAVDRATRSDPYAWGEIVLTFDVTADGRPANVRTADDAAAAPGTLADRYVRRVRETHFRPRLVDGVPVATENVEFTHYFRYYVDTDD